MDENYINLTVTSSPYDNLRNYKGYHFDYEDIAKNLFRVTKDGGLVVWVVGDKIQKEEDFVANVQGLDVKKNQKKRESLIRGGEIKTERIVNYVG